MNLNQSFILEVKTEFQPVIKNLSKYEAFINHLFQKDPYPLMSLETLKNGCLYFFKSGREFMDFVDRVVEKLLNLEEKIEFHKKSKLLNFFVHRVLKKKTFPAEGTEFLVRFIGNDRLVKEFF